MIVNQHCAYNLKNWGTSPNQLVVKAEVRISTKQADTLILFLEKAGEIENPIYFLAGMGADFIYLNIQGL